MKFSEQHHLYHLAMYRLVGRWRRHRNVFCLPRTNFVELLKLVINWTAGSGCKAKINRPADVDGETSKHTSGKTAKCAFGCGVKTTVFDEKQIEMSSHLHRWFIFFILHIFLFAFFFFFNCSFSNFSPSSNFPVSTEMAKRKETFLCHIVPHSSFCWGCLSGFKEIVIFPFAALITGTPFS